MSSSKILVHADGKPFTSNNFINAVSDMLGYLSDYRKPEEKARSKRILDGHGLTIIDDKVFTLTLSTTSKADCFADSSGKEFHFHPSETSKVLNGILKGDIRIENGAFTGDFEITVKGRKPKLRVARL